MEKWQPPHRRRARGNYSSSSHSRSNESRPSSTANYVSTPRNPTTNSTKINNKQDNSIPENAPNLIGTCIFMCPTDERLQRERLRDLSIFERLNGNPSKSSSTLAVKKFCRTISSNDIRNTDLRPLPILQTTVNYLFTLFESEHHSFESLHDFIFDRTRSIRQDLTMQNIVYGNQTIEIYEKIVKFHIISHHKLQKNNNLNSNSNVSPMHHLNMEQLTKTLSSLYNLYAINQKYTTEFYSFYVLLHLNSKSQPSGESLSLWFRNLPYSITKSSEMTFSRKLLKYFRFGNYKRFLELIESEASCLQYYIIEPYISEVRAMGLSYLNFGGYKLNPYPLLDLSKLLLMEESDVELFCRDCGLDTFIGDNGMKFMNTKQSSFCFPKGVGKFYPVVSKRLKKFYDEDFYFR